MVWYRYATDNLHIYHVQRHSFYKKGAIIYSLQLGLLLEHLIFEAHLLWKSDVHFLVIEFSYIRVFSRKRSVTTLLLWYNPCLTTFSILLHYAFGWVLKCVLHLGTWCEKKTILGNDNSSGHVVTNWKLTSSEIPLNIKVSFYEHKSEFLCVPNVKMFAFWIQKCFKHSPNHLLTIFVS